MLDSVTQKSAVIAAGVDWAAAFDRLDPTITANKLIKIGVRPALVAILISYMTNRRMIVRFKGQKSSVRNLVGGGPQGTLLGGLEYIISNDDCAKEEIQNEDRFKYYDDLNLLEFLILSEKLIQYDFNSHVASDIGVDQLYLPSNDYKMQNYLNYISEWTKDNLMLLNEKKSCYIIFSRSKSEFSTRLTLNEVTLERKSVLRILGLWLQEDLKWDYNTKQFALKPIPECR